jgi:hypothetical protein
MRFRGAVIRAHCELGCAEASGLAPRRAPAVASILVTECPVLVRLVIAQHVRTKQSLHPIVDSRNRLPMSHRHVNEPVDLFQRLHRNGRRHTHFPPEYRRATKCLSPITFITRVILGIFPVAYLRDSVIDCG